jgi:acyl-CoA reductase-like NAD-dependent aldehyde dehydrogenase
MADMADGRQNHIGGAWVDGGAGRIGVTGPATGETVVEQALADAGGVETPLGGYGKSGFGREKGREALWNYGQTRNTVIKQRHGRHGPP